MLLMPLNSAMAIKARRQAPSAVASSELAGCCRSGPIGWFMEVSYLERASHPRDADQHRTYRGPDLHNNSWLSFKRHNVDPQTRTTVLFVTGLLGRVQGR